MTVQFSTTLITCFCNIWRNKTNKILHFILFCLFGFSQQTFDKVGTRTVIWWQVVSKMFAPKIIKICQSFFKSESITLEMLIDTFLVISTHSSLVLTSPGSAEVDNGWGKLFNGYLMASCAGNIHTKNYLKWISLFFKWESIMFGMFFSGHSVNISAHNGKPRTFHLHPLDWDICVCRHPRPQFWLSVLLTWSVTASVEYQPSSWWHRPQNHWQRSW